MNKTFKRVLAMVAGAALCATMFMGLKTDSYAFLGKPDGYEQEYNTKYWGVRQLETGDYLNDLQEQIICESMTNPSGVVYWEGGDSLSKPILQTLALNPDLTLKFKFTYDKVEREISIKGSQVSLDGDDVEWYGPVVLLRKYGK